MSDIKFGIVLPTYQYNEQRRQWAKAAFASLARTITPRPSPALLFVCRNTSVSDVFPDFEMGGLPQPEEVSGTEQTLAWGTEQVLNLSGVSHVVWLGDDALFHPMWLFELRDLISRHPNAKGWSVYRSAHVAYHAPLRQEGDDVLVRSLCGHGMTFTREEWKEWGVDWRQGQRWPVPSGGNTLDLHHAYHRPGERWVTAQSYVEHTGRLGVNVTPDIPEYAVNFQGTELA